LGASAVEPTDGLPAAGRHRDTLLGHHLLERREPDPIGGTVVEQARTLTQRLLVGGNPRSMGRVEPEHESIEKPPAAAWAFEKKPVHRRCQPYDAQPFAECGLAACRLAVDAHDPPLARRPVSPGANAQGAAAGCDEGSDRPPASR